MHRAATQVRGEAVRGNRGRTGRVRRITDFILYVAVGIAMVAGTMLLAVFTTVDAKSFVKWCGFGVTTALVFTDAVRTNRNQWRESRFWLPLAACLAAQLIVGLLVLQQVPSVPTLLWAFFLPADYVLVGGVVGFFARGSGGDFDSR